jgi:protein-tyrosine kinase
VSKIHEALRKLQKQAAGSSPKPNGDAKVTNRRLPETVIPIARKKKTEIDGVKHHLDEKELIRRGLLAPLDQAIPVTDEFRRIKRPLIDNAIKHASKHNDHMNLIMVASALSGAGKTFCAVNLAASLSLERELNVLLVDADVAKPHISTAFGLVDKPGLIDILEDETTSVNDALVRTDLNDIQVLPAGRKHSQSTELLASDRMDAIMHELATRYADRLIVMDSPPLLLTSEAQAVARQAGQIVLVAESGKTTNQEIQEALELLDPEKAINIILNKSVYSQAGGYYGGGYGYGNYGFNEET